ncbi:MAG: GTPase [Sedimentisphaerales bacterium]|jgi:tRNA modification GTPase
MNTFAAVITGKGTGAIATIQICGDSAKAILSQIFIPANKPADFTTGKILLGTISDGSKTIDQVTVGCEGPDAYAINCHGNPLIVEEIMQSLQQQGVELLTTEQFLCKTLADSNTIALEVKLNLPNVKTIEGTQLLLNQINSGLTAVAKNWLESPLTNITTEAKNIIKASQTAKLIIFGCRTVLAGPPNTGKSTLLNCLCGKQKSIVTDIKGTTRDWVSASCRIGPLAVELIDTAGLDEKLADDIDKATQQTATELITQADIVLLVLDSSEPVARIDNSFINILAGKKVLTVLNKSDLPCRFKAGNLMNTINISAKLGTGIDLLCTEIQRLAGVENFDPNQPICFTARQEQLLTQLAAVKSKVAAHSIITELLSGPPNV